MVKQKSKNRIKYILLLIGTLLFMGCFFIGAFNVSAESKVISAELYMKDSPVAYRYFDFPTAIYSDSDSFYIAHNNTIIDAFSINNNTNTSTIITNSKTEKIRKWDNKFITLESGAIYIYDGSQRSSLSGSYVDFDIASGKIFALSLSEIVEWDISSSALNIVKQTPLNIPSEPKQIACANNVVFIASVSPFNNNKFDISLYTPLLGAVRHDLTSVNKLLRMNTLPLSDSFIALSDHGFEVFEYKSGGLIQKSYFSADGLMDFSVSSAGIYALTNDYSVKHFATNGANEKTVFASSHTDLGFFNSPQSAVTRRGNLIVADTLNNRITVSSDTTQVNLSFDFYRPESVTTDHTGNIYVAHSVNQISVIDPAFSGATLLDTSAINDKITELVYTSELKLYALTKGGELFVKPKDELVFTKYSNDIVLGISTAPDLPFLYATTGNGNVLKISASQKTVITVPYLLGENFCVDKAESFYFLSKGYVTKYQKNGTAYTPSEPYSYASGKAISAYASHISISTVNQPSYSLKSGDLIVTDAKTHCVRILKKEDFSVSITDGGNPPDISGDDKPSDSSPSERIIRVILQDCEVYATESEINRVAVLKKGFKVIVPSYNPNSAFSMIIADNTSSNNKNDAVTGYVYNDFLSEPLEYTPSPEQSCRVWQTTIAIYKYPTRQSPMLDEFKNIQKGTTFKLMDFCFLLEGKSKIYGFTDNFAIEGITWYKVSFGENDCYEGYVMKDGMSVRNSNPDPTIRPQFNAVIISADKENPLFGALTYEKVDEEYIAVDAPTLAVGVKVEVVGFFDTSLPYTKIRYSTEFGTVECYVKTENIQYQGVNVVIVIVVISLIVTLALIAGILLKVYRDKKKLPSSIEKPNN